MIYRNLIGTVAFAVGLTMAVVDAWAFDQAKYPDWAGAWRRVPVPGITGAPGYDQTKRLGPPQQAPLPVVVPGLPPGSRMKYFTQPLRASPILIPCSNPGLSTLSDSESKT